MHIFRGLSKEFVGLMAIRMTFEEKYLKICTCTSNQSCIANILWAKMNSDIKTA